MKKRREIIALSSISLVGAYSLPKSVRDAVLSRGEEFFMGTKPVNTDDITVLSLDYNKYKYNGNENDIDVDCWVDLKNTGERGYDIDITMTPVLDSGVKLEERYTDEFIGPGKTERISLTWDSRGNIEADVGGLEVLIEVCEKAQFGDCEEFEVSME